MDRVLEVFHPYSMKIIFFAVALFSSSLFASICVEQLDTSGDARWLHCPRKEMVLFPGTVNKREVLWQTPAGKAPSRGWPAVLLSQGSWFPIEFSRPSHLPFGAFNEVLLIKELLDQGFAVIAPRATLEIGWITNMPHRDYEKTADYKVLREVLRLMKKGDFGPLDSSRFYATGISSGGYNTSRLVLTFPGVFQAVAIQSGSYANCLGPLCKMPDSLPGDHPPTLLLHGKKDIAVPLKTARNFHELLKNEGIETEMVVDPSAGHAWINAAPKVITDWFQKH